MLGGLRWSGDYEMVLNVTGGGASAFPEVGVAGGSSYIATSYTPDYIGSVTGLYMFGSGVVGAVNEARAELEIPARGIFQSRLYSGTNSVSMELKLLNVRLFVFDGSWTLKADAIVWRVNGVVEYSTGAFTIASGMPAIPSAIPLIGIPPFISGGAVIDPLLPLGSCLPEDHVGGPAGNASAVASGGWRIKPTGESAIALPITLPSSPLLSGTNTYNVTLSSTYEQTNETGYTAEEGKAYSVWIIPDNAKSVTRMNSDYESLLFRWGAPSYGIRTASAVVVYNCFGTEISNSTSLSDSVVLPAKTQFLGTVFNPTDVIEDLFASTPCWFSGGRSKTFAAIGSLGSDSESQQWLPLGGGSPAAGLVHPDPKATFVNTWLNPHYSYGLWFPPDDAASSVRWDLLGADSEIDYWHQIRQQHVTHPSLPSGDDTKHRVNVITEPIVQNGVTGLCSALTGNPCWWGNNQFTVETETFPDNFTTNINSAPRFAFKDGTGTGTGTVGTSTITLTTGDAIEFELASFTDFPFMVTTLSDRIRATFTDPNISAVKLFATGLDTTKVQIGPTAGITSGTIYRIPFGDASKFATSAGGDFGAGYLTDVRVTEAAVAGDEITSTILPDEKLISNFGLLPGYSPIKIRIEITRAGSYTGPVTIDHLTFFQAPWVDAKVFHETGQISTILFKDGPAVRFGALSFFDYIADSILSVPAPISSVSNRATIGDLWCWENVYLRGVEATTNLLTRMNAEFVVNEEFPAGVTKHLWRYRDPETLEIDSISGVFNSALGPKLWYLNTRRNVPPLAIFPEGQRLSSAGWVPNSTKVQSAYSEISYQHPHIVPGNSPAELNNGGSNKLSNVTAPSGWTVGVFQDAVTNNESTDWMFRFGGINWFKMRPWRGQFFVGSAAPDPGEPLTYDVLKSIRHTRGYLLEGNAYLDFSSGNKPYSWSEVDLGIPASHFDIAYHDGSARLYILVSHSGVNTLYWTIDEGQTLTSVMTIGNGNYSALEWTPNNLCYVYRLDGGTIYGRVLDAGLNVVKAEAATNLTGIADAPFDVRVSVNADQQQVIGVTYKIGSSRYFRTAVDGFIFS